MGNEQEGEGSERDTSHGYQYYYYYVYETPLKMMEREAVKDTILARRYCCGFNLVSGPCGWVVAQFL